MPTLIPRYNKLTYFAKGDLNEHFKDILFMGRGAMYKLKGKNALILPHRFRKPIEFFEMLGISDAKKYYIPKVDDD